MTTAPLEPVTDPGAVPDDTPEAEPRVDPVAPGEDPGVTPQSDPEVEPAPA